MKRAGFTMIELIFVIVILGILAAVAVPKLAATRADAQATADTSNARNCLSDLKAARLATGAAVALTASGSCATAVAGGTVTITQAVADSLVIGGTLDSSLNATHNLAGTAVTR